MSHKKARAEQPDEPEGSPEEQRYSAAFSELDKIQEEVVAIQKRENAEHAAVEAKYLALKQPIFARRKQFVQQIPEFWLCTFSHRPILATTFLGTDEDSETLKALEDVEVVPAPTPSGAASAFTLRLHFKDAPYFTNTVLEKAFVITSGGEEPDHVSVNTTEIEWREGKNVLAEREKQRASERAAKHRKEGKEGAGKHERDYDEGETCGFLEFWAKNSDTALQQEIAHNVKDILEDPVELYSMDMQDEGEEDEGEEEEEEEEEAGDKE